MLINTTREYPEHMKRGFIAKEDRKMVHLPKGANFYRLKVSSAQFKWGYEGNYYHQSNIFSRIMARVIKAGDYDRDLMLAGEYVVLHDRLLAGDGSAWAEVLATCPSFDKYKRLVPKCIKFIQSTDDCFNMLPMIKSYWTQVLKLPAPFLSAYIAGLEDPTDGAVYSLNRLLTTPTFKALDVATRDQWLEHLIDYTKDVNQVEKLEAVRDYAVILGDDYIFLTNSCNELLL